MANLMLIRTLIQTLVQLQHSSHVTNGQSVMRRRARGRETATPQRWNLLVPMCSYGQGSIREASGTTLGVSGTGNLKENKRFYGFTDFRGKPAGRGRGSRASANQVTAGLAFSLFISKY